MCLTSNAELLLTPIILAVATFTYMIYSSKTLAIVSGIVKVASKKAHIYFSALYLHFSFVFFLVYLVVFRSARPHRLCGTHSVAQAHNTPIGKKLDE
jgi:hypothetical protein